MGWFYAPMQYEVEGEVYHVTAGADCGKTVLEDDKDRCDWFD
jgi:hypothetical protein